MLRNEQKTKIEALLENFHPGQLAKKIVLRTADCIHLVNIDDIIRCEADSNYTYFYLASDRKILVSKTIKEFDHLLKPAGFLRVHQSHLINPNCIDRYIKSGGGSVVLTNGLSIPISKERKTAILEYLESLS
jgi:two-component system LytT family response regulator